MPSAKEGIESRPAGETGLLRGSDLPRKQQKIKVKVIDVRNAPYNFNSPFIIDIETVLGNKTAFPLNKTNTRRCAEIVGDELNGLKGATITLSKALQNNPQSRSLTFGLVVDKIEGYRGVKPKRKSKR